LSTAGGTDACATLAAWRRDPGIGARIAFLAELPGRPARVADLHPPLHPDLEHRLTLRGVRGLWTHQVEAIRHLRDGAHVVLATSTASGKSLCYQLPILDGLLRGEAATALLVFPTKALAQDQLRSLRSWLVPGCRAVTYDGDTPADERAWARRHANVVLTNPEMLHQGILPNHRRWSTFLMRLRLVVVDELHTLRGVFGSHVALVLRRLRRLCARYGSAPVFCFASATIGNPGELAAALVGAPVHAVVDDGSPQAGGCLAVWRPPEDDADAPVRLSGETAAVLSRFVRAGHVTLAFTRSRRGAEVVALAARRALADRPDLAASVAAYRAGLLPEERRRLERALSAGDLRGVAATTALELGIDVGGLDAVVLAGFPGTLASMRQQLGRAGRRTRPAAGVLVVGDDQLDRWYATHPDELLARPSEPAVVNPANPFVLDAHVRCAAYELPLVPSDVEVFGDGLDDAVRRGVQADELVVRGRRVHLRAGRAPAPAVGLRSGGPGGEVELVTRDGARWREVGTVELVRAPEVVHPGAVYLHQGRQWLVRSLDLEARRAELIDAEDLDEYTRVRAETEISVLAVEEERALGPATLARGRVEVTRHVTGYQRVCLSTGVPLGSEPLDVPPHRLPTRAAWYRLPRAALAGVGLEGPLVLDAAHAAEHALIGLLPLFAICDRWDVGGVSTAWHPETGDPTIFIYDGYPGGAGIAELAFACGGEHVRAAAELVAGCPCTAGCPSCVQSPKCGNWNEHLDKAGAVALLELLGLNPAAPASDRGGGPARGSAPGAGARHRRPRG
jgi:DEAD/DEAH box helicase domain-containing protein